MPDLDSSLLSVGQFLRDGYLLLFEDFSYTVYKDKTKKNMLFKVPMSKGNLFPLTLGLKIKYYQSQRKMTTGCGIIGMVI